MEEIHRLGPHPMLWLKMLSTLPDAHLDFVVMTLLGTAWQAKAILSARFAGEMTAEELTAEMIARGREVGFMRFTVTVGVEDDKVDVTYPKEPVWELYGQPLSLKGHRMPPPPCVHPTLMGAEDALEHVDRVLGFVREMKLNIRVRLVR